DRRGEPGGDPCEPRGAEGLFGRHGMTLLEVAAIETFYGKSQVLRRVSFEVPKGQISALLGRNGAGKSTTLRSIMGLTPPRAGAVRFNGQAITSPPPHCRCRRGVGRV